MKTLKYATLVCAIAAASMGFSSLSLAQNQDFRHGHQARPQVQQPHYPPHHGPQHAPQVIPHHAVRPIVIDNRHSNRLEHRDMRRHDRGYYANARGPQFRRGGYIPREFRHRQYVVNDYRLAPPPRGQQWVQVGGDYVLIGIATGLIASVILNH